MKPIDLLPYITDRVQEKGIRHEVHQFDSGAAMVDIWVNDKFYVIQIDDIHIGLSLVTEDTMLFDIIPDQVFTDAIAFKASFDALLLP